MVLSDRDAFFLALPGRQLMHVRQTRRVAGPAGWMRRSGPPWPAAGSCFGARPDANTLVRARPWMSSHLTSVTGGRLPDVAPGATPGMPTSISSGCRAIVCRHICHWNCRNSFFNKDKKRLWRNYKNAKHNGRRYWWVSSEVKVALCTRAVSGSVGVGVEFDANTSATMPAPGMLKCARTSMSESVLRALAPVLNRWLAHLS